MTLLPHVGSGSQHTRDKMGQLVVDNLLAYKERRAILVALGKEMDPATPEGAASAKAINTFVDRYDSGDVACAR